MKIISSFRNKIIIVLILLAGLAVSPAFIKQAQADDNSGVISGRVIDPINNNGIGNMQVYARVSILDVEDGHVIDYIERVADANQNGFFEISGVTLLDRPISGVSPKHRRRTRAGWGKVEGYTTEPEGGYRIGTDVDNQLYYASRETIVNVSSSNRTPNIRIEYFPRWRITQDTLPMGYYGENYRASFLLSRPLENNIRFVLLGGTLPSGLSLNPRTGIISGTPARSAAENRVDNLYQFTIALREEGSNSDLSRREMRLVVATKRILRGTVKGFAVSPENPNPLPTNLRNASIEIENEFGNTELRAGSAADGGFSISNIRPAGIFAEPIKYNVRCSADGYYTKNITLESGSNVGQINLLLRNTEEINWDDRFGLYKILSITTRNLPDGVVGRSYKRDNFNDSGVPLESEGGFVGGRGWRVVAGALPPGLALTIVDNGTRITGTPTRAGDYNFTLQAIDAEGHTARADYLMHIMHIRNNIGSIAGIVSEYGNRNGSIMVEGATVEITGVANQNFRQKTLTVGGRYSFNDIPAAGYYISFKKNNYEFPPASLVLVTSEQTTAYNYQMVRNLKILSPRELPPAFAMSSYSVQLSAEGGLPENGAYAWSYSNEGLPQELLLDEAGRIFGRPTSAGSYDIAATVTDRRGRNAVYRSEVFHLEILPATELRGTELRGTVYDPLQNKYLNNATIEVVGINNGFRTSDTTGNKANHLYMLQNVPRGRYRLTCSKTGYLPMVVPEIYVAADTDVVQDFYIFQITPEVEITSESLPQIKAGISYNFEVGRKYNIGRVIPISWSIEGGMFPRGLSIDQRTGAISGIPQMGGNFSQYQRGNITVRASTESLDFRKQISFEFSPAARVSGRAVDPLFRGADGALQGIGGVSVEITGANGSFSATTAGDQGFDRNGFYTINNVPQGNGYAITFRKSGYETINLQNQQIIVNRNRINDSAVFDAAMIKNMAFVGLDAFPVGYVGENYTHFFSVDGGKPLILININGLPSGLNLIRNSSLGTINGTPQEAGRYPITISARDGDGRTISAGASITIAQRTGTVVGQVQDINNAAIQSAEIAVTGTQLTAQTNANGVYRVENVPIGQKNIVCRKDGYYPADKTIEILSERENNANFLSLTRVLTIESPQLDPSTASAGQRYRSSALESSGGQENYAYVWKLLNDNLPGNLSIGAHSGEINWDNPTAGVHNIQIEVHDSAQPPHTATKNFILNVNAVAPLVIQTDSISAGMGGRPYISAPMLATGGVGDYHWRGNFQYGGSFSDVGITINATTGVITLENPRPDAFYLLRIHVSDSGNPAHNTFKDFEWQITHEVFPLVISSISPIPSGKVGMDYNFSLNASGGEGQYVWTSENFLPDLGLIFGNDGKISGRPSAARTFEFNAVVNDSQGRSANKFFSLTIDPQLGSISGKVIDLGTGQGLAGVRLAVVGTNLSTITGNDGNYNIANIPVGDYVLRCEKAGYSTIENENVRIFEGPATLQNFEMAQALQGAQLRLTVLLQGRYDPVSDSSLRASSVVVQPRSGGSPQASMPVLGVNNTPFRGIITLNQNGNKTGINGIADGAGNLLPEGDYFIVVKNESYLPVITRQKVHVPGALDLTTDMENKLYFRDENNYREPMHKESNNRYSLKGGYIVQGPDKNEINIYDLILLTEQENYDMETNRARNPEADINGDGSVGMLDLNILTSNDNYESRHSVP